MSFLFLPPFSLVCQPLFIWKIVGQRFNLLPLQYVRVGFIWTLFLSSIISLLFLSLSGRHQLTSLEANYPLSVDPLYDEVCHV